MLPTCEVLLTSLGTSSFDPLMPARSIAPAKRMSGQSYRRSQSGSVCESIRTEQPASAERDG